MELTRILTAGEKHFFAKTYNDVKLDNIANDLGIKKPSLYYYFKNKRDFYIQTLKFSMKSYTEALKVALWKKDFRAFVRRYLEYPSREHNLFAIAAQQWYGDDKEINTIIWLAEEGINKTIKVFLDTFHITDIQKFLVLQLLDKLARENCTDTYCLEYSVEELTDEIEKIIMK